MRRQNVIIPFSVKNMHISLAVGTYGTFRDTADLQEQLIALVDKLAKTEAALKEVMP